MPENSFTAGAVRPLMLRNALAMIPGTLAMSGYNLADTYFVGNLPGELPLAAMGFTMPIVMFVGCLFRGLAIGIMTTAAQSLGMKRDNRAVRIISAGLLMVTLVSILFAVCGVIFGDWLLEICGASGDALKLAQGYMTIWFVGCFTALLSMTGADILIASGSAKAASLCMIGGMLLNIALDPLFIYGLWGIPRMEIEGAALATVVSQSFGMFFALAMLTFKYKLLQFRKMPFKIVKNTWFLITKYAVPASAGMLMIPLGAGVLTKITSEFGNTAVAACNAAARIEMAAFVVPMSLGMSLTPFIGQNYGAKHYDRIIEGRKFAIRFATFFLLFSALIIVLFRRQLSTFFASDEQIREVMNTYLLIVPWGLWAVEIHRFSGFVFTGCAKPSVAALLNAMRILGFLIPFSLIALYMKSLEGLFAARLFADIISAVIAYLLARKMCSKLRLS